MKKVIISEKVPAKEIRDFLRKAEFKYPTSSDIITHGDVSYWKVKLIFKGRRDQMYFFES